MAQFPAQFRWGTATAAYQVEGAANEDGRGESIWDRFCSIPGKVRNGDSGLVACDHYHRYREDVPLIRDLGLNTYRFSIAWPRILPQGRGQVNALGLDFYDRLVDTLLAAGIEPFVTLYHWDLPQALQDEVGGWASRETSEAFANYADVVSRHLGDRVQHWITLNEPWVSAFIGHESGEMAPGLRDSTLAWQTSHHLLLAHGLATPILQANGGPHTHVGITLNLSPVHPATTSAEDVLVAQIVDGNVNRWFLDPVFRGCYPADMLAMLGDEAPHMESGDAAIIAAPLNFLGVNYYTRLLIKYQPFGVAKHYEIIRSEGAEHTAMGWEVYPSGLYELLMRLHKDYTIPTLYVTENGAAFVDTVSEDGHVHDPRRLEYLREHLLSAQRAIADGVPLAGYFVWSLLDNFEWAHGYTRRFGIVYVDYPTQRRFLKDSGQWYHDIIAANGLHL